MAKKDVISCVEVEKDTIDATIASRMFDESDIRELNVPDEECTCEVQTASNTQICTYCFDLSLTGIDGWRDNPAMQRDGFIVWGTTGTYSVATDDEGESFGILTTPRFIDPRNVISWTKVEVC